MVFSIVLRIKLDAIMTVGSGSLMLKLTFVLVRRSLVRRLRFFIV